MRETKSEHLTFMKVKSECLYLQKTESGLLTTVLEKVRQTKFEHLIHMKAKSERLIYKR